MKETGAERLLYLCVRVHLKAYHMSFSNQTVVSTEFRCSWLISIFKTDHTPTSKRTFKALQLR